MVLFAGGSFSEFHWIPSNHSKSGRTHRRLHGRWAHRPPRSRFLPGGPGPFNLGHLFLPGYEFAVYDLPSLLADLFSRHGFRALPTPVAESTLRGPEGLGRRTFRG